MGNKEFLPGLYLEEELESNPKQALRLLHQLYIFCTLQQQRSVDRVTANIAEENGIEYQRKTKDPALKESVKEIIYNFFEDDSCDDW